MWRGSSEWRLCLFLLTLRGLDVNISMVIFGECRDPRAREYVNATTAALLTPYLITPPPSQIDGLTTLDAFPGIRTFSYHKKRFSMT